MIWPHRILVADMTTKDLMSNEVIGQVHYQGRRGGGGRSVQIGSQDQLAWEISVIRLQTKATPIFLPSLREEYVGPTRCEAFCDTNKFLKHS